MNTSAEQIDRHPADDVCWIWPIRFPKKRAQQLDRLTAKWLRVQTATFAWIWWSLIAGVIPVLLAFQLGVACDQFLTLILATPVLLASTRSPGRGIGLSVLLIVFLSHSVTVIVYTVYSPGRVAAVMPFGQQYWQETVHWIETGANPEYELSSWVPAHLIALGGVPLLSYVSLGAVLFFNGLHQLDMMNVYVGNLILHSDSVLQAIGFGWHPWSICRGIGFLILAYHSVEVSMSRLVRCPVKWSFKVIICGCGFLFLDGLIKLTLLESVRTILHENLVHEVL